MIVRAFKECNVFINQTSDMTLVTCAHQARIIQVGSLKDGDELLMMSRDTYANKMLGTQRGFQSLSSSINIDKVKLSQAATKRERKEERK